MDSKIINTCLYFGKFLAFTPSTIQNKSLKFFQKIHPAVMFLIFTIWQIYSLYQRKEIYWGFSAIQLVLKIVTDIAMYAHIIHILIRVMILRYKKWYTLFKILLKFETNKLTKKIYLFVVLPYLVFFVTGFINYSSWIRLIGIFFVKLYLIELFQTYSLLVYMILSIVVLKIMLENYRLQNHLLGDVTNLRKVRFNLFLLNKAVEIFNDIFGWTIPLTIFYSVARTLMYFDLFTKDSITTSFNIKQSFIYVANNMVAGLIYWVRKFSFSCFIKYNFYFQILLVYIIFLCDLVTKEFDKILAVAYKIETWSVCFDDPKNSKEILKYFLNHRPNFTAARFFTIDRSTIFSICNSFTSFLIIIIQFKIN